MLNCRNDQGKWLNMTLFLCLSEPSIKEILNKLSKNYYAKGLTTKAAIGKVYCPVFENGVKKASSHWINLVTTAESKYKNYKTEININDIINKEELA